jgi:hypothetical protein
MSDATPSRQVAFFSGKTRKPETFTQVMKRKIDSVAGQAIYNRRMGTVEPLFGNLSNIGLNRFTLRAGRRWMRNGSCTVSSTTCLRFTDTGQNTDNAALSGNKAIFLRTLTTDKN